MTDHRFQVGQKVSIRSGERAGPRAGGVFKILRLMPPTGTEFQYRIKSVADFQERVVREAELLPA